MTSQIVCKFGGSSLADAGSFRSSKAALESLECKRVIIVVSALHGITDLLLEGLQAAKNGNLARSLEIARLFQSRHVAIVNELINNPAEHSKLCAVLESYVAKIHRIFESLDIVRDSTERMEAQLVAHGERASAQIFAVFLGAEFHDAATLLRARRTSSVLAIDREATKQLCSSISTPDLGWVVVPGFIASTDDGELVTLGRGGTDFSAAIIAQAVSASKLILFKEVDGVMTADPRWVRQARIVPQLDYREAAELAYYGAKILHPKTMMPLMASGIPLMIKNTFFPDRPGTEVNAASTPQRFPVKALSAIRNQVLIKIEGRGMQGVPGVAARAFAVLARRSISVSVITQASSESSICFVIAALHHSTVVEDLRTEFAWDLKAGEIDCIEALESLSTIAVVGSGMSGSPGIAGRVFASLGRSSVNVIAIAQGSSELNITLVVEDGEVERALEALHGEFQLHKSQGLETSGLSQSAVTVYGLGQIGRELIRQMRGNRIYLERALAGELKVQALIDRSGLLFCNEPLQGELWESVLRSKEQGESLKVLAAHLPPTQFQSNQRSLWQIPSNHSIFVDASASDSLPMLLEALENDFHIVLANKKPLTVSFPEYQNLFALADQRGLKVRFEATVGAGLPVLDTLEKMAASGDEITEIVGCLSGTLGYVFSGLERGELFSEIVARAFECGYTEPDPRDDLDGQDVARKSLILARYLGWSFEMADVSCEPLFSKELSQDDPKVFLQGLKNADELYRTRVQAARKDQSVLRYIARISAAGIKVGIEAVALGSGFAGLQGTDNQVMIRSRRYQDNPLMVRGPGAGAGVTAQGVLNDIVTIARSRRRGI